MSPRITAQKVIRDAVTHLGFSHHQAARVFGVTYGALHSWLVGSRSPSKRSLRRVAEGLEAHSEASAVMAQRVRKHLETKP